MLTSIQWLNRVSLRGPKIEGHHHISMLTKDIQKFFYKDI